MERERSGKSRTLARVEAPTFAPEIEAKLSDPDITHAPGGLGRRAIVDPESPANPRKAVHTMTDSKIAILDDWLVMTDDPLAYGLPPRRPCVFCPSRDTQVEYRVPHGDPLPVCLRCADVIDECNTGGDDPRYPLSERRCDFCDCADPQWCHPAESYTVEIEPGSMLECDVSWWACSPCSSLIEAGDHHALALRSGRCESVAAHLQAALHRCRPRRSLERDPDPGPRTKEVSR